MTSEEGAEMGRSVLLLGGTGEARRLAAELVREGVTVVTSLAGAVADPLTPAGGVRVGGFGGVSGLGSYLREQQIGLVVDATHPFAGQITANAAEACLATGTPLLRLSRPGWSAHPDAASWHWVESLEQAKASAQGLGSRAFLSIGRRSLASFADWTDRYVLVRVVDAPEFSVPDSWEVMRARGPFRRPDEVALLSSRAIEVLVTKDSGGRATAAKLDAASELGIPVVIVRRPADPEGVPVVTTVAQAVAWVASWREHPGDDSAGLGCSA